MLRSHIRNHRFVVGKPTSALSAFPMGPCSYIYIYGVYLGLKVGPMSLPLGLCMHYIGTWTKWNEICLQLPKQETIVLTLMAIKINCN